MREFVKDYVDICEASGRFYKKHWKGVILLTAVIIGAEYAWSKYNEKRLKIYAKEVLEKEEAQ